MASVAHGGDPSFEARMQRLVRLAISSTPIVDLPEGQHVVHRYTVNLDGASGLLSSSSSCAGSAAPVSKAAIEALKDVGGEGQECAICLEASEGKAAAAGWKEMPCGHRFHGGCLEKWLRVHGSCPMCRRQMPPDDAAAAAGGSPRFVVVIVTVARTRAEEEVPPIQRISDLECRIICPCVSKDKFETS